MQPDQEVPTESVQCFLSYARADSAVTNDIAREIRTRLAGIYRMKTGKTLEVFLDRDSIGWGEDWRDRIASSVRAATVFIPLITMNYFNSTPCREELIAFYNNAKVLGVTDLVLPIVVAGERFLSESDPRDEVSIVLRYQYECVESAWPCGYSSSEWLTAMNRITDKLIDALDRAENRLAALEDSATVSEVGTARATEGQAASEDVVEREDEDTRPGLYDLLYDFKEGTQAFADTAPRTTQDLSEFLQTLSASIEDLNAAPDRQALNQRSAAAANRISPSSMRLATSGAEMLVCISSADAALRQLVDEIEGIDAPEIQDGMRQAIATIRESFEGATEIADQFDRAAEMLKFIQRMSVSLRRAVAPGYRGFVAVRDAVRILKSWEDLGSHHSPTGRRPPTTGDQPRRRPSGSRRRRR